MSKTTTSDKEIYHDIFVPLLDVYDEGGPLAFTEFDRGLKDSEGEERNLIVVPISYIDALDVIKKKNGSWGASDSLKFINNSKSKILPTSPKEGFNVYRLTQGLDLCVVDADAFSRENFNMMDLEKQVMEFSQFSNVSRRVDDPQKVKIITDDDRYDIKYSLKGHTVRKPEFLMANEDLVNEGIITANDDLTAALYSAKNKSLPIADAIDALGGRRLYMNQFVKFTGATTQTDYAKVIGNLVWNADHTRVVDADNVYLKILEESKKLHIKDSRFESLLGISPQDMEQYLVMQYLLLNNDVSLSFIAGGHGSGKTVLAWAHALDSALIYDSDERRQRGLTSDKQGFVEKVILMKAIKVLGDDVGYLPGNLYNKLKPHLRPFTGAHRLTSLNNIAFEELFRHPDFDNDWGGPRAKTIGCVNKNAHLPPRNELVELVYSGFVGGASEPNIAFVVDEAQDFTPYEMMVILQRVGLGSRMTITGDPWQCRNPKCTLKKNGFTFALKHYLPKQYTGLVKLTKNYRHQISEDATDMNAYPT